MTRPPLRSTSKLEKPGFALVVTLTLMVLLSILALGLLSLAGITLRSDSQNETISIARANARTALMLALADLQQEMGPDSRISAPSDAGSVASGGRPGWTAVFDAWKYAEPGSPETPGSRNPKFRKWLVSGIDPASGQPVTSAEEIAMLGKGTLGQAADPARFVTVKSQVLSGTKRNGQVAWWISDEGVKAKVNAGPETGGFASFGKSDPLFHSQSPPNIGQEVIAGLEGFVWQQGDRDITVSTKSLNLAAALGSQGLGDSFHDITVHSAGVLADVRAGRLKRDLSTLLGRPIGQLENKPLYAGDGTMNRFVIGTDGSIANGPGIPSTWGSAYNTSKQWGINMEELHLFHSLHRNLSWSGSNPSLVMPSTREAALADRHFLYKRPGTEAMQFIFSLKAVPDTGSTPAAPRYKMQMHMDAMVALWNPNDVPLVYPPGLELPFQLLWLPYDLKWNIQRSAGAPITSTFQTPALNTFKGLVGGKAAAGFTLRPGEAAVFGSGTGEGFTLDLQRGLDPPKGRVALNSPANSWNLTARGLTATDGVDFEFLRSTRLNGRNWVYTNTWIGTRDTPAAWQMDSVLILGAPGTESDAFFPPSIKPPQVRPVSDFINEPQPVIMLSFMKNVERSSGAIPADGFASRPYMMDEPSQNGRHFESSRAETDRHGLQAFGSVESLEYKFKTLAAGEGGRSIYIGGGRQPGLGGSFEHIARRIPAAPPLSIAAFQHGIATGFADHFNETTERVNAGGNKLITSGNFPQSAASFSGNLSALPLVSHAIGNSFKIPNVPSDRVFEQSPNVTVAVGGSPGTIASDHSWMANNALWDSWFLSGIVDGTGSGSSPLQTDNRSPRQQFSDLAGNLKPLRNTRFIYHPYKTSVEALSELFDGDQTSGPALNLISNYLLIDGAFNVNSTSAPAWEAILASVRDQKLLEAGGGTKAFKNPFGTIGYAASSATAGNTGDWSGLRDLENSEIKKLAAAIVTEVRARAPFLSMADFINRRPDSSNPEHQVLGALQAAIEKSGLNARFITAGRSVSSADFGALPGRNGIDSEPAAARAVGAPGHLSQGDILTALGAQITVRSDTFVIRAYGDAREVGQPNRIAARAWCEAVVQRLPEYVNTADNPEAQDGWPSATDRLKPENTLFGRRFVILSFRWLHPDEI